MESSSSANIPLTSRVLEYRAQVKISAAVVKYLTFLLFIFLVSLIVYYFFVAQHGKDERSFKLHILLLGSVWLITYMEYLFLLKPLAISKIKVYKDRILITQGKKEFNISFDEIIEIKSVVNKNLGGYFQLMLKNKKKYKFTIALERSDYILDSVIKFKPELMEHDKYLNLRKHLILADHAFGRIKDRLTKRNAIKISFYGLILPLLMTAALYSKQSSEFIVYDPKQFYFKILSWFFILMLFLSCCYDYFANIIIDRQSSKRLEKNFNDKSRDKVYESKIQKRFAPVYLTFFILFFGVIYKTDINTLGKINIVNESEEFNLKIGETLWYDSRYNCTDCPYKLRQNDLVMTSVGIGKIVGLYPQKIVTNKKDKNGRFIASNEEKLVPKENIAIKSSTGETLIVENKSIKGKVFKDIPHF